MKIIAIDPAPEVSAFCLIDSASCDCIECGKVPNERLKYVLSFPFYDRAVVEGMSFYGKQSIQGFEHVIQTAYQIGRFCEVIDETLKKWKQKDGRKAEIIRRRDVKSILGLTSGATDGAVIKYLTDRFAPGEPNYGKGTKDRPGWFYGFKADIWQAYALGVAYIDRYLRNE